MNLLEIKNLHLNFKTRSGEVCALRDVSFNLEKGQSLGVVGESGSGKSLTALSIMGLLPNNAVISQGKVLFKGLDLMSMSQKDRQQLNGSKISMIFQDPLSSLNPSYTVEQQLQEMLKIHKKLSGSSLRDRAIELMNLVGIPDPQSRLKSYPHQLSGGMSQRIMIAMSLSCSPELLIADEPTTALDVTIQKQIVDLLVQLQKKLQMSMIFISHDLGLVADKTDRVAVMYTGEVVEHGLADDIFSNPSHPYTLALLRSLPSNNKKISQNYRLPTIPGIVPSLFDRPKGCQLAPRCELKDDSCERSIISTSDLKIGDTVRQVRCLKPQGLLK